jgi:hypothetical protein
MPEMMLALTRIQGTMFDAWMRQSIEMMDFLKARFERDRKLAAEIAKVGDPSEAVALWTRFWQKAAEDYADEPRRLASVMTEAAGEAFSQARKDAETLVERTKATAV